MKKWIVLALAAALIQIPAKLQAQETPLPVIPGRIAYIGTDYNVYLLASQENTPFSLTTNAGINDDILRFYQWPTWSTDGRLAYFATVWNRASEVDTEVYVSSDGSTEGETVYIGEDELFNYAYWSPQNCSESDACRDLAVLLSRAETNGLLVELIRTGTDVVNSQLVGTGSPFYYSWSPDGARMLLQRNGSQIDIYDTAQSGISDALSQTPGRFSAPAWSPVDDRLLFGVRGADGTSTDLVIVAAEETQTLVEGLRGVAYFGWSPDGNNVAYMDVQTRSRQGTLIVIDAVTGERVAQSSTNNVFAFFWSPDSEHIAYITPATLPGSFSAKARFEPAFQAQDNLAWSVMDVQGGEIRGYGAFVPTDEMMYLLTYFDQFAQSHRLWSPDSRHIVYSELTSANEAVISLIDAMQAVSVPLIIAEGIIGVWSFN